MEVQCTQCSISINKSQSEIKKSRSGNHFCSSSCSATYNNSYRNRKDRRPEFTCMNCSEVKKSTHNHQKFCSLECQHESQWNHRVSLLESGGSLTAKNCKRYHTEKDYSCSFCGIYEWRGESITLELDHINGDGTNNTIENTRLLCPNCHSQTDTYKSKNTHNPNGKEHRVKRYAKSLK